MSRRPYYRADGGRSVRFGALGASPRGATVWRRSLAVNRDPGLLNDIEGLKVRVFETETATVVGLRGEWDLAGVPTISRVLAGKPDCLVLDLSRLGFIDSSGPHATIELTERSAAQNPRLVIIARRGPVRRMFELTGHLHRLPFIDESPKEATATALHPAQGGNARPGAFLPQTSGAPGDLHPAPGPARSSPASGPHAHHAPAAERWWWPGTGGRP